MNRIVLIIAALLPYCAFLKTASAANVEKEKMLLEHAAKVCLRAGNSLFGVLDERQQNAFFSPLYRRPGIRIDFFPVFVGEPTDNPRGWNAFAQFTDQGNVCIVLTQAMVKSLYLLAIVHCSMDKDSFDSPTDELAKRVADGANLGFLHEKLGTIPRKRVDQVCTYLASGIVAHEFAHIYLGHLGTALRARGLSPESTQEELTKAMMKLAYRREQEAQADLAALENVIRVDRNRAIGMLYVYDFLARVGEKTGSDNQPAVLRTHPDPKARINYLIDRLDGPYRMNVTTTILPTWYLVKYRYRRGE